MISRTLPNGVVTTTNYDGLGRMKFWKNVNASSTVLNEFVYGYNTANQIISITEPSRTRNFGYDNSDRLTSTTSTQSGQNENYAYDSVGNRTSSHLSSSYGYQQGSFNRLTSTQQTNYTFDSNGNVTSKSEGNDKWYYFYDRENRLVNATKFGGLMPRAGQSVGYQYDALGRRVVRQDKKSGRTEFTHDGMDVLQDRVEKSDGTNSTTNYINGLGIDDKLKLSNGTTSRYFLTDHLGSTVGMSDSNGAVSDDDKVVYDSFGKETFSNGVTAQTYPTRYRYTGREADEATGLMYYRARFYDPQVGRFTSEDPIGFVGGDVNLYGYVRNNPMRFNDPFGTQIRSDRNWQPGEKNPKTGKPYGGQPNWSEFSCATNGFNTWVTLEGEAGFQMLTFGLSASIEVAVNLFTLEICFITKICESSLSAYGLFAGAGIEAGVAIFGPAQGSDLGGTSGEIFADTPGVSGDIGYGGGLNGSVEVGPSAGVGIGVAGGRICYSKVLACINKNKCPCKEK